MSRNFLRPWPAAVVVAVIGFGIARPATADGHDFGDGQGGYGSVDARYEPNRGPEAARRPDGPASHIDEVAGELEAAANELCLELYYNYQANNRFREVYGEAYEILATTRYIHSLEHAGNERKMRQVVAELDGLFRHVCEEVEPWRVLRRRHIGRGGLSAKLEAVGGGLSHMMEDLGLRPGVPTEGPDGPPPREDDVEESPGPVPAPGLARSRGMLLQDRP